MTTQDDHLTHHAAVRSQQRGIPPLVEQWLDEFGEENYDGHGGICRYFSRRSYRNLQRAVGNAPFRKMREFLDGAYKIESATDSRVITVGYRDKRIRRK